MGIRTIASLSELKHDENMFVRRKFYVRLNLDSSSPWQFFRKWKLSANLIRLQNCDRLEISLVIKVTIS